MEGLVMQLVTIALDLKNGETEVSVPVGTKFNPPIKRFYGNISYGSNKVVVTYLKREGAVDEIKKTLIVREASADLAVLDGIPTNKWHSLGVVEGDKQGTMYLVIVIDN